MINKTLITCSNVVKYYPVRGGLFAKVKRFVKAVDSVSLEITEGENFGIVGESGSGKTTLARLMCGLIEPTSGKIEISGKPINEFGRKELAKIVQPIFQDPYSALNPWKKVREILELPYKIHGIRYNNDTLCDLLRQVGLYPPESFLHRYPHELSGGQRQRVVIARALALRPRIIIADEPVSALDVTVQRQILRLMRELQETYKVTYVIISHSISLVEAICDKIAVMYLGKIVELGPTHEIINRPVHPYTVSLLKSFPTGDPDKREWIENPPLMGDIPSAINPPSGCRFRTRCSLARAECASEEPALIQCGEQHYAACPVVMKGESLYARHNKP